MVPDAWAASGTHRTSPLLNNPNSQPHRSDTRAALSGEKATQPPPSHRASRSFGSNGGYIDFTTSSTLKGGKGFSVFPFFFLGSFLPPFFPYPDSSKSPDPVLSDFLLTCVLGQRLKEKDFRFSAENSSFFCFCFSSNGLEYHLTHLE